jgi:molybdenum cofactor cytidylyltransferase
MGILILAAGAASRMKQPKMLLAFEKDSILSHIIDEAKTVEPDIICLVTGYYHLEIIEKTAISGLMLVHNENWQEGMASSIKKGVEELTNKYPDLKAILILVSDQPYINCVLLKDMLSAYAISKKGIVAAYYANTFGTPVLFDNKYFQLLMSLKGDIGAKSIIRKHPDDITTVAFPLGEIDIDTKEEYEKLSSKI